ncbi:acetyl-CoA synthetase-like protein [Dacryopinax primogenitus]|uniref:Acetyl-CoA synthetase-like protein n=1 Tax=Dacryopinax primogenitus (strain DJM 731) TaxID=1858805 RepID=M5FYN8_DACPD|nr:acetyl-CoA synthetase-like protein [Dacryopinax primogenitus]EJT98656.1 acetyl-CoA synthetase-like protein [Dacryopinax primogenitus]
MTVPLNGKPRLRYPPGYVTEQGRNAPYFTPVPFDGSLLVGEFIDWHREHSARHNYCILVEDGDQENVPVTYSEFAHAVHRVARLVYDAVPGGSATANGMPKTVALLSNADVLTYNTLMLGIMRAGFEVFPISNRNSEAGIKHLITAVDVHYLVGSIGGDGKPPTALQTAIQHVIKGLKEDKYEFTLIPEPQFSEIYPRLAHRPMPAYDEVADAENTTLMPPLSTMPSFLNADIHTHPCLIMHSSGSTKFPKPIRQNQQAMRHWISWPWYGDADIGGSVASIVGLPGFHAGGITFGIGHPLGCGVVVTHFMPQEPAIQANADTALFSFKKSNCDWCFGIPAFLDSYSNDPEIISFLATKSAVVSSGNFPVEPRFDHYQVFGSSPLPEEAGDRLVAGGVNLVNIYGATETNIVSRMSLEKRTDWLYTEISPMTNHRLQPDDETGEVYRLVFEANDHYSPAVYNLPGERAYDTYDVAIPHPTRKNRYRILGRSDDQIMHSTGEKTNPGPLENIILGSPLIKSAVYFGRARTQAGVIIEPFIPVKDRSEDAIAAFRNKIWPYIERANQFGPSHSRVFKEYVLVADSSKPLARTPKGSIARSMVLAEYEQEIEQIYQTVQRYNQYEWAQPPTSWDKNGIYKFVARVVNGVMEERTKEPVDPQRDLFEQGCDSLQATLIRNSIINALRHRTSLMRNGDAERQPDLARNIPQSVVFMHSTILSLAAFVTNLVHGTVESAQQNDDVTKMLGLLAKYNTGFLPKVPAKAPQNGVLTSSHVNGDAGKECVLLTGSTGTLGAYLLSSLLLNNRVEKVYAFNRSSKAKTIGKRQLEAFVDRGIPDKFAHHPKLVLIEGDSAEDGLGIDTSLYDEMLASVTCIIHNAWRLDFNMGVQSFESHIRGSRNLIDFALKSQRAERPQFLFTSSIGTVANWKLPGAVPEEPLDAEVALGTGYGESKWVVDRIMIEASKQRGLRTTTFRIGQLAGSMINGAWNTTDWVPHIVKAACILGSLPLMDDDSVVSWLPADAAALSIVQAMEAATPGNRTLHVCHPYPTTWNFVMETIADYLIGKGIRLDLEPYPIWFGKLEASGTGATSLQKNPALKLLDFLRPGIQEHSSDKEAMGFPLISTTKMQATSNTLKDLPRLDQTEIKRWMEYWDSHGVFE